VKLRERRRICETGRFEAESEREIDEQRVKQKRKK